MTCSNTLTSKHSFFLCQQESESAFYDEQVARAAQYDLKTDRTIDISDLAMVGRLPLWFIHNARSQPTTGTSFCVTANTIAIVLVGVNFGYP
jgi:hypothetical protein